MLPDLEELERKRDNLANDIDKLRQVLSAMTWRHIQELKKVTVLTQEDVDTIKGVFR